MICTAAALLCIFYYLILVIRAGIRADFAWIWLLAAGGLGIFTLGMHYEKSNPGFFPEPLKWAAAIIVAAGVLIFLILLIPVLLGMTKKGRPSLDYVIVLGAQVRGTRPSRALKKRLDAAAEYAGRNPDTIIILSGGQGEDEEISEAECMNRYLAEKGTVSNPIVLEDRSVSTRENLIFSDQLTGCRNRSVGILSNNFHICRAILLARKCGYEDVCGIAAPSDRIMQVHYVVREVFALVKERALGNV